MTSSLRLGDLGRTNAKRFMAGGGGKLAAQAFPRGGMTGNDFA